MSNTIKTAFAVFLSAFFFLGCKILDDPEKHKKKPAKPPRKVGAMEANLDDDLDETERKAIAPIFENEEKERRRREKAVFGID